ncbi:hypothetical protein OSCI_3930008 [Kamptonema sp. PCC 6506]|nr:hypothetical protein OSCI_3930008 [Kamptonema sp. PCC 6506]
MQTGYGKYRIYLGVGKVFRGGSVKNLKITGHYEKFRRKLPFLGWRVNGYERTPPPI